MKVTVNLSEWYARGNVRVSNTAYEPLLLSSSRKQCCLGFCAVAHGVRKVDMAGMECPVGIKQYLPDGDWMIDYHSDSDLAELAMNLNDGSIDNGWRDQPLEVRMGNLITVFAEGGDELEFVP